MLSSGSRTNGLFVLKGGENEQKYLCPDAAHGLEQL